MMGRKNGQLELIALDVKELIPQRHLLKQISQNINFNFIYEKAKPYYSNRGRKSIDPVVMIKMLLIGYLYGIKSERRLEEEITLNLAYRWFCGLALSERVPDHSTFSQNRRRRFKDETIFREIFNEIIIMCIDNGSVSGETVVSDGSFIPSNVAWSSRAELKVCVAKSSVDYLDSLQDELSNLSGYTKPRTVQEEKVLVKSKTDKDCGYINQRSKKGLVYLTEITVDTKNGIVTGVDVFSTNRRESDIILRHLKRQMDDTGLRISEVALDSGYDVGAVHRGLEVLGITGYSSSRECHNNALKKGFSYDPASDSFICIKGKKLCFEKIVYKKTNANYYRAYGIVRKSCNGCEYLAHCSIYKGKCHINASSFYPSYYANQQRVLSFRYKYLKKLQSIWSEGTFSVLKREHNLKKAIKRGIHRISEECLLSALSLT